MRIEYKLHGTPNIDKELYQILLPVCFQCLFHAQATYPFLSKNFKIISLSSCQLACGILVSQSGIENMPPALAMQSLKPWPAGEVSSYFFHAYLPSYSVSVLTSLCWKTVWVIQARVMANRLIDLMGERCLLFTQEYWMRNNKYIVPSNSLTALQYL